MLQSLRRREFLYLLAAPLWGSTTTRAVDVVAESNVIDMLGLLTLNWNLLNKWCERPEAFSRADFSKLRSSGIDVFHPAVALGAGQTHEATRVWFDKLNRLMAWHSNYFVCVEAPHDLTRAKQEGKIGIILGMQDANHLRCVDDVDAFYEMGQRVTQLTYNSENQLGDGCLVGFDKGLTAFGAEVVTRMNEIGMAIDISHCGQRTSLDAIAASTKPVLITHSNCRALMPGVARCKSDEVIRAAARSGGVLGITSVRSFVTSKARVTIDDVLDHFDHAVELVGVEHVGLGSDFDLDAHPTYDVAGLNDARRIYELTDGLLGRGYSSSDVSLMLGGNFQRALCQIWE